MEQASFFDEEKRLVHGGESRLNRRKEARPLASRRPLHLVLKARRPLLPKKYVVTCEVRRFAKQFGLTVYDLAVASDHVHFALRIPSRNAYNQFVRALSGTLARMLGKNLWRLLPYTRVASWGRDFKNLLAYLEKNREEAEGLRAYEPRKKRSEKRKVADPKKLMLA